MELPWLAVLALLLGIGLAAFVLSLGKLSRAENRRFVCPVLGTEVVCALVRNVRTGQWTNVLSCSALGPGPVLCERTCAAVMNQGFPLEGQQGRP